MTITPSLSEEKTVKLLLLVAAILTAACAGSIPAEKPEDAQVTAKSEDMDEKLMELGRIRAVLKELQEDTVWVFDGKTCFLKYSPRGSIASLSYVPCSVAKPYLTETQLKWLSEEAKIRPIP